MFWGGVSICRVGSRPEGQRHLLLGTLATPAALVTVDGCPLPGQEMSPGPPSPAPGRAAVLCHGAGTALLLCRLAPRVPRHQPPGFEEPGRLCRWLLRDPRMEASAGSPVTPQREPECS